VGRNKALFPVNNIIDFKKRLLAFANSFDICCCLETNYQHDQYQAYDFLFAIGAENIFSPKKNILTQLKSYVSHDKDWLFGHINYDLKNEIESLTSSHEDNISFPEIFLFHPKILVEYKDGEIIISCTNFSPHKIFDEINNFHFDKIINENSKIELIPRINKDEYISTVNKLREHILRGDCYEINFCQEFFAENISIDPLKTYHNLSSISPAPFSSFYKIDDKYLFCSSPERYFKKDGERIIVQPIKGTLKRSVENKDEDELLRKQLFESAKDRSENVMIVDLIRNDLSKICKENSVTVKELFGIYSFAQVHQMISTIEGEIKANINFADILKATFPMGSMTGAPKKKVMELIEKYEATKRGIYSGCVGYISPDNDMDFNVVIRSLMYNATEKYISCQAGSAITFYSNAEEEYNECLLKAFAMKQALT
jgi:para-aminobenzoate synthetase component I